MDRGNAFHFIALEVKGQRSQVTNPKVHDMLGVESWGEESRLTPVQGPALVSRLRGLEWQDSD